MEAASDSVNLGTKLDPDSSSEADSSQSSSQHSIRSTLLEPEPLIESEDWLDATLRVAKPWISYCLNKHEKCRLKVPKTIPTRLVDVGPQECTEDPFLFITGDRSSTSLEQEEIWSPNLDVDSFRYTALSYCWGDKENLTTTVHNLDAMKAGIAWGTIPATIQDAILVTRKLGIRYLWVDALCIVQGPGGDWKAEHPKMADVYGGAFLTISAALSPNVWNGFRQSLESPLPMDEWARNKRAGVSNLGPRVACVPQEYLLANRPLYKRGWALQERILSRRILLFCRDGVYWDCESSRDSEPFPKLASRGGGRLKRNCVDRDWQSILQHYACRSLTRASDKLPALSGVAMLYHRTTKNDYLAGLWKQSLLIGLLWRRQLNPFDPTIEAVKPLDFRAPSWSWASIDANYSHVTLWEDVLSEEAAPNSVSTIVDAHVDLKDPVAPFGEVTGGFLILRGPLILGTTMADNKDFRTWLDLGLAPPTENTAYLLLFSDRHNTGHGLVLVSGKGLSGKEYERVGVFLILLEKAVEGETELGSTWMKRFGAAPISTVKII
ncbi:heterokaryon incompatibility protein-domain-containing protein [Cadophora sp. MPI-SDFR-AT-0126]|nr:heterokaryon incompatibility protein-domain-containing protein [Leotiomycetes sp. MPI-SDFR-AT-0126]